METWILFWAVASTIFTIAIGIVLIAVINDLHEKVDRNLNRGFTAQVNCPHETEKVVYKIPFKTFR